MATKIRLYFWTNRKWITKVIVTLIIFCVFYFGSLLVFPQWKTTTRGLTNLICSIFLGIILKLKDIDELVDKWFFKTQKYQISDDEKATLKWMYSEIIEKRNRSEFTFGYWLGGKEGIFISDPEELRNETIPIITKGILSVLMRNELIWFDDSNNPTRNQYKCRICTVPTKIAIESDFKA